MDVLTIRRPDDNRRVVHRARPRHPSSPRGKQRTDLHGPTLVGDEAIK
jgi:hypothetical protein